MLYVFNVDLGTLVTFDIALALQSVVELKEAIERDHGIPVADQVLLINGGESLEGPKRVCSYSAGLDSNPIYLFNKGAIERDEAPTPVVDYGYDVDFQSQVDTSLALPATFQTIAARAQLAQQCCGQARETCKVIEKLVFDQHLQQQGWSAVTANLDDITQNFRLRAEQFQQCFSSYLTERKQHMQLIQNFSIALKTLEKIPILPALRAQADGLMVPEEAEENPAVNNQQTNAAQEAGANDQAVQSDNVSNSSSDALNLLKWISAKDNQNSLEQVAEVCARGLEQFDEKVMEALKNEVNAAIEASNKEEMRSIKGLGERLFSLEHLSNQAKKLVQSQSELAQGFQQNKTRCTNLNDESVLPDLCTSHRNQLLVMLNNHNQLRDIRKRCGKAKEELACNIYRRLKWIMYVENKMMEVDSKLVMFNENLRRLRRQMEVLRQIQMAPEMYMSAIAEVVRRRTFSQAFLVWASQLACQLLNVHSEEIERRRKFQSMFEGHFLNTLFPGLEDTPPPFATQAPAVFDNGLPKLTFEDMESLRQQLPDLAASITTPDLNSITQFFFSKSLTDCESSSDGNKDKESNSMPVDSTTKDQEGSRPALSSERGVTFDSEIDSEEFEKIGQAVIDSKATSLECSTKQSTLMHSRVKQLEVGVSQPLDHSISNELLNLPSITEKQPLSPLTEETVSPTPRSNSLLNPTSTTITCSCDGQPKKLRQQSGSDGSSPSVGNINGANDFLATDFYMDESLPSSLSEHPTDSQHQAILSILQENLGSAQEEVERYREILRNFRLSAIKYIGNLRNEMNILKEQSLAERSTIKKMVVQVSDAVKIHAQSVREREQELTVDHELEMADLRNLVQQKDEELLGMKRALMEKEQEVQEQERLARTIRLKFEAEQLEMKDFRNIYRQMEERLERAQAENENATSEINSLKNALNESQERVRELEEKLIAAEDEHQKALKEETEKIHLECKTQLDTIRSRFKLMTASTMERCPSDSSLEKIERVDVIELINHETILAQAKKDSENEKEEAIRAAVERERETLSQDLQLAKEIITRNEKDLEMYRQRELALMEDCRNYKSTLQRLEEAKKVILDLKTDKSTLECTVADDLDRLEKREALLRQLEVERDELRRELEEERLKMSQSNDELEDSFKKMSDSSEKDEVRVSESKKVRLEGDRNSLSALEADNKRLSSELRVTRENKERIETKCEALENERLRLEVELAKERSKSRNMSTESMISSTLTTASEMKDMNVSVAVVTDTSNRVDASTSTDRNRRSVDSGISSKLVKSTSSLSQQQSGKITTNSCNTGDVVMVIWNQQYRNFMLVQDTPTLYFLNGDSMADLDLKPSSDGLPPSKLHAIGEIVDKEYCSARKAENRYRVPQGTRFYRVKVKPVQRLSSSVKSQ